MFERRRRAIAQMSFLQSQRALRAGELIPPLPGIADQILACRSELIRASMEHIDVGDLLPMADEAEGEDAIF
jgi:hypothetical protein